MSDDVRSLIARQGELATRRANTEAWWQQIAERVMPQAANITVTDEAGSKRNERLFSGRPVINNERFAAVMDDLLTPRTQVWHMLAAEEDDLADDQEVKEYFEAVNRVLFAERYRPRANFASQKAEGYLSIGALGNSCLFIDENVGEGIRYKQTPMREIFWAEGHSGQIDLVHRRFCLTGRQALQAAKKYGWQLSAKLNNDFGKNPMRDFLFLHAVGPNQERVPSRKDFRGMAFSSHYVCLEDEHMLSVGGYTSFPYAIGRYMLSPGEVYARSPAMAVWGAILTLNEQKKTILRAGQKEVDPPLLLSDDGALEPFNLRPGALNPGTVSQEGQPLVHPLKLGSNIPMGVELMDREGLEIDDSFLVSIYRILAEHPQMTATQVLELAQTKAVLLAPIMGRQHSEDLGPLISRELDLHAKAGKLPDMPEALIERGGSYKIEYRSPLARAMRAQDGVAIMRTMEALGPALAIDPDAALVFDVKGALRELGEINGMPAKLMRDPKVVQRMAEERAEANEAAAAASVAPDMSQAALNAAKAEQLRMGA